MEMVPGLSEQLFQRWIQLRHRAMSLFFFLFRMQFFKAYAELLVFVVVFCAGIRFEMLSRIYRGSQQLQQLAMPCNKVGSVTLQRRFSSLQHRASLKTGAATLHIHCSRSLKFLTQGQVSRSDQLTLLKKVASTLSLQFTYDQYETYRIGWGHQYLDITCMSWNSYPGDLRSGHVVTSPV